MTDQCSTCFYGRTIVDTALRCHFGAPPALPNAAFWPEVSSAWWCGEFSANGPAGFVIPTGYTALALGDDYQIVNTPTAVYEVTQSANLKIVKLPVANENNSITTGQRLIIHCAAGSTFGFYIGFSNGSTDNFMGLGMWAECILVDNSTAVGTWRIRYFPNFAPLGFVGSGATLKTTDTLANVSAI